MKTPGETCVLIVEDDPSLREAVAFAIERKGYRILKARSGNEAAKMLRTFIIDVVISDIRMADGDGRDLLRFMRELHPELPVMIFMTGYADFTEEEAIKLGARCMLRKPFERTKMIAELDKVIGYERPKKSA